MSMFHVGQRVACIAAPSRAAVRLFPSSVVFPEVGCVYTIRAFVRGMSLSGVVTGLVFEEIVNPSAPTGVEYNFAMRRFRPVKDTSIEIFRSLLSPIPEEVR